MRFRSLHSGIGIVAVLCLLAPTVQAGELTPRARVGDMAQAQLSTSHPYPGVDQTFEIHHPGATYIKVHFSRFELAPGDRLEISSPDGQERYFFQGRGYKQKGENFWGNSVLGDRVILRLQSVTGGDYGFDVDSYAFGLEPLFPDDPISPESVCGVNDWLDVVCYESSYPVEFDRAKRAVVVLYNGTENCTGVKIGCPNQILTNEHCVTSQSEVDVTEVRFEFQTADCGGGTTSYSQSYLGDLFIDDDYTLDYSVITVEGESSDYEAAEIDPRLPPVGERMYITGHPAGNPKKLSLEDSSSPTGLCQVDVSPQDGRGTDTDIGYYCDTTGGSSGSPVWSADSHKLIALHHYGGCPNGGIRMDLIYPHIESLIASCCDLAPSIPTLSAVTNGDNRIDLAWDDADLATVIEYHLYRSRTPGGPYTQIATIADSSPGVPAGPGYAFNDLDVSGGITYYYMVRSTDGEQCTSEQSAEAQATATGSCTLAPIFFGAESVNAPLLGICTLELSWSAATPECGSSVTYNIYRSTVPEFTPGAGNQLASGLTSTAFIDIDQLVDGTTYYYKARAVDTSNGSEDNNIAEVTGVPVGQPVNGTWTDDAGDTDTAKLSAGSAWSLDGSEGNSGPSVYKTGTYSANTCSGLATPALLLGLGSQLTFWSHYDLENSYDKGEVQISTNGGVSWQRVPVNYPGSSTHSTDSCGLPTGTYFTGTDGVWAIYTADLSAWADQNVQIRWAISSDSTGSGSGWWIDDITITNVTVGATCATGSSCEDNPFVNVTPEGPLTVCWGEGPELSADLAGGSGSFSYQWIRDGQPIPGATGPTYIPNDLGLHSYNVRVKSAACADAVFDGLNTQLFRVNKPFFGGITSAINPQDTTCTVNLDWEAASTVCAGPVRYYIYRDTTSPVDLSLQNLIATDVYGTEYVDTFALANMQTYHYVVRAQDASTGQFDDNVIEAAAAPDGPGNGLVSYLVEDFESPASFADWTVTTGPGPHNCGDWALTTDSSQRPTGSSGSFAVADGQCAPLLPLTSTTLESPAVDLDGLNMLNATLYADVRYDTHDGDDAKIEIWDGSEWIVLWTDPDGAFNQHVSYDVLEHVTGNSDFRVRFDYQNSNADMFLAVDNVDLEIFQIVECATAAEGPPSIPAGSLLATRAAGATDEIDVIWDAASCPAAEYNLLFGDLAQVGSYTLSGSDCSIGSSGSYSWSGMPAGNLYFLVVGAEGSGTESSWGRDGLLAERNGTVASGECGASVKDVTNVCY